MSPASQEICCSTRSTPLGSTGGFGPLVATPAPPPTSLLPACSSRCGRISSSCLCLTASGPCRPDDPHACRPLHRPRLEGLPRLLRRPLHHLRRRPLRTP